MAKKANGRANGTRGKKQPSFSIPGMTRPDDIDEVDAAIADYLDTKQRRKELQNSEPELLAAIQSLLQDNKRKKYVYIDGEFSVTCTLDSTTKLHFKRERFKYDVERAEQVARDGLGEQAEASDAD